MNLKVSTEPDAWKVTPTPGYVLKFTEVDMKTVFGEEDKHKCFLNVCHCKELPPPLEDIDEDKLASRIDRGDVTGFRIPVSIGELDSVVDNKNINQPKIDVYVNSVFYEKKLAPPGAEFFRHFFCMVICDAIEEKHHLKLDPNKCVKLKNRTVMGSIEPVRIAKKPTVSVIQELGSDNSSVQQEVKELMGGSQVAGVSIRLLKGTHLEIELALDDVEIQNIKKLRLRVNKDRVVLLADNRRSLYDFCVPFYMNPASVRHKLAPDLRKLIVSVPVVYP